MTALAMIIGMLPMSLSGGQNAPLGKAVIGGLLVATIATLLFVPTVFSIVHAKDDLSAHDEGPGHDVPDHGDWPVQPHDSPRPQPQAASQLTDSAHASDNRKDAHA